jgi:cell division protein FtsI (penicillin-binding protein 3)
MLIFTERRPTASRRRPPAAVLPAPARRSALSEPGPMYQMTGIALCLGLVFTAIAAQVVRLGYRADGNLPRANLVKTVADTHARPDILDRNGRLLATDVEVYSFFVDPSRRIDRDELIERLSTVLPDIDTPELRRDLADTDRQFLWVRRGLSPRVASEVHNLGIPGLSYRKELRRAYPLGALAGHTLGQVNTSNLGVSGIERHIDEIAVEVAPAARPSERPPLRLSIDVAAQAALEAELADTQRRLSAKGAAAVIMDANTGEIVAASSLPRADPHRPYHPQDPLNRDRLQHGTYELGSIFKAFTVAMALDVGRVTPETMIDVRQPLILGRRELNDPHPAGRPLSVSEIFILSSNVGTGKLALDAGTSEQRLFLARAGLLSGIRTEAGPIAPPQIPARWERTETITISYGHGLALAPLQFAAAAAALVNGGVIVEPTYLQRPAGAPLPERARLISEATSEAIRQMMRRNVTEAKGTGRRADVPGLEVGGKTGTADIAGPRGYRNGGVISSFLAAFPMSAPKYVALVLVFEPKGNAETGGKVLAGVTAAPAMGRILARVAPLLER